MRDKGERRHRKTHRNAECVATMAGTNFDAVPSLSEAMGLETEQETKMSQTTEVYVVRDASGEYIRANGERTPASDEAAEFETRDEASAACTRATDKVLSREVEA